MKRKIPALCTSAALAALGASVIAAPPLSGAIFTTTVDGTIVNENVRYEAKEDVYLDGGPGPNAPAGAAGLPEGDYYFQVTDPSGKDLLSTDHISCRKISVSSDGVITQYMPGTNYEYQNGQDKGWVATACKGHATGTDYDHEELGAITVQLYPYDDTPNPGGVYKVWVTPIDDYACSTYAPTDKRDPVNNEGCSQFHGFIPAASKTDNYKVKERGRPPLITPELTIRKFHDKDNSGTKNEGDEEVFGWTVDVTDPLGVVNTEFTDVLILAAEAGTYSADEENPTGTVHTYSYLDGVLLGVVDPVNVDVLGEDSETHEIWFGNVGNGSITACKWFDKDTDGNVDDGEPPIPEWMFELYAGTDISGSPDYTGTAGDDGCFTFEDLGPGTYTVVELVADGYTATGQLTAELTVESTLTGNGDTPEISGSSESADFTNFCEAGPVDFGTKGYWHNKNGLQQLTTEVVDYVNGLDPYDSPSDYFGAGDEPFDGFFEGGSQVEAAFNQDDGSFVWGAGTYQAEVSHFLIDPNGGGDPAEQLAQQLLAFIFNTFYRLDGPGASILVNGTYVTAGALIDQAINVWANGSDAEKVAMQELLNGFNESDALMYIPGSPCPVNYTTPTL
jgi:hypothetical protein